jgi:hypothetical protein
MMELTFKCHQRNADDDYQCFSLLVMLGISPGSL